MFCRGEKLDLEILRPQDILDRCTDASIVINDADWKICLHGIFWFEFLVVSFFAYGRS